MRATRDDQPMTVEEFLDWAAGQPGRYELVGGRPLAMAPERAADNLVKARVWQALDRAIAAGGLPCQAFTDGMTVRIDADTAYEPDALVRCGAPLPGDAIAIDDPLIVVEVLSLGTREHDSNAKLIGYFKLASLQHYLILDPARRSAIHYRRTAAGPQATVAAGGPLELSHPGLTIDLAAIFAD
jgi:Uma2 family endonuclease